jgi:hypothetical protein
MKLTVMTVVALVMCATPSGVLAQKQIRLLATVSNPSGEPIASIATKDVDVAENGVKGTIVKVDAVDRVSKVQILIDNGIGIPAESLGDLRNGLRGLLEALPPGIETTIVTTAPQPRFIERGTTDRQKLLKAVDLIASDTGAGRFVESLFEATERIERDKQESSTTIVSVTSTSGDLNSRDSDIKKIMERTRPGGRTRVHVIVNLGRLNTTVGGGGTQLEVGEAVAKQSLGRFEKINVGNRLATLLPELGAQMASMLGPTSRQFRITVDRPAGTSGDLGKLTMSVAGLIVSSVMVEN